MADLKISELNSLAGADLVAADVVAVVDDSASETKKLTVSDLIANGVTLISDSTIPSAKILFSAGAIDTAELAASAVETAKINDSAVTAAKLADNSSVTLVSTLPASGAFTGQIALDTDDNKIYVWDGSAWDSVKGAGSINVVNGSTTGEINIVASTSGDTVTISATLDNTTAAAQFLGGPTGAAGAVGYRALVGSDLPTATTTTKGGIIVNGEGLRMDLDTIEIANDVTANSSTYQAVQFNSKGLITAGRDITAADLPEATAGAIGGVKPGSGLSMGSAGAINHSNAVTGATNTKITFDAQGHVTAGTNLSASDIPDLDTAKITTGEFPTERIADEAVTAGKLANYTVAQISETTPTADFTSQFFFNPITRDLFLWDGNVFQPVGISAGEIVLAGTYDASTNLLDSVTADGTAAGFTNGAALPAAATGNNRHYVVVSQSGTGTSPAPTVSLEPPDILLSNGTSYVLIETSETITAQIASNVGFTATGNLASTNVQSAIAEVDNEKVAKAGDTMTGDLTLNNADVVFEGATENDYETTLTVTDPTADRTITLPDVTGTVVTTGDTGSVTSTMIADGTIANADISASAEIAVSKLANGTARQLLQTDAAGTGVEFTSNVDVPGTFDVAGAGTFDTTLTVTGVISADGKVKFPAGTAAAPSFYSGTDTDTGLYFSAADEVSVATGGTQRVVFDSSGRVIVGTTTAPLNGVGALIQESAASGCSFVMHRNDTTVINDDSLGLIRFYSNAGSSNQEHARISGLCDGAAGADDKPGKLVFYTTADGASSPSERLRIDSSGRVAIGTSSPGSYDPSASNLVVGSASGDEGITIAAGTSSSSAIDFADGTSGSAAYTGRILYQHSADALTLHTNGGIERVRIDSSGRLLVGTSTAGSNYRVGTSSFTPTLQVEGTNVSPLAIQRTDGAPYLFLATGVNVANGSQIGYVSFNAKDGTNLVQAARIGAECDGNPGTNDMPGRLVFSTTADGSSSPTERMRIGNDGVVQISMGGSGYATLFRHGTNEDNYIRSGVNGITAFGDHNGGERMRIRSDGHVLIGTTTFAGTDGITLRNDGYVVTPVSYSYALTGSTRDLSIDDDGYLGIITSVRDAKTNIQSQNDVDWLYQLEPVTFNYKTRDRETGEYTGDVESELEYGLIAEDVETVCPDLCFYDETEDGPELRGVSYKKLITPMLKALQDAKAEIDTLKAKVAALEAG